MVILTMATMFVILLAPAPELMRIAYAAVILTVGVIFVSHSIRQDRRVYDVALTQAELLEYITTPTDSVECGLVAGDTP